jgi:hypothetical protein
MTLSHHHAHDRLSDYEIAINFGDTLQIIYKAKMEELNNDLQEAYTHIFKLQIPQVPELHRYFAMESMPGHIKERFQAVKHIQTIRGIYKKIKSGKEFLNVEQARNVDIKKVYDFKFKGKNVSCPFHQDLHPSASIKYNRLICFQCGAKMDSIALFQKLNNVGFKEAVEYLNKL